MASHTTLIDALNAIAIVAGGSGGHKFLIDALNDWSVAQSGTGGHRYTIDALNEIAVLYGAAGGHKFDHLALNAISVALSGVGGHALYLAALNEIVDLPGLSGGGEEPELLADINFVTGSYTVGVTSYAVTDVLGEDAIIAGTVFDTDDIIPASGLRGASLGGTSIPGFIGPLFTAMKGTVGCSVLLDVELEDEDPANIISIEFDSDDFAEVVLGNLQSFSAVSISSAHGEGNESDTHPFDDDLTGGSVIQIAMTLSKTQLAAMCSEDVAATELLPTVAAQADFDLVTIAACYRNNYKYWRRMRVYAPLSAAQLPTVFA